MMPADVLCTIKIRKRNMAWTTNQIWRWTHITFATLFLAELLFGAISALVGASEAVAEGIFIVAFAGVVTTGFGKWPLYPWYMKRKSKSKGRFKLFGPWNGNQTWRWIHISTGSLWTILLADGLFLNGLIFGDDEEALLPVVAFLIAFFGTIISGLAKWPIYPWYKKRKNKKRREEKISEH